MARYCSVCGAELRGSGKFCMNCGAPAAQAPQPQPQFFSAPQPQRKKSKLPIIIICIAAVLLLGVAAFLCFISPGFLTDRSAEEEETEEAEPRATRTPRETASPQQTSAPTETQAPEETAVQETEPPAATPAPQPVFDNPFVDVMGKDSFADPVAWAVDAGVVIPGSAYFQPFVHCTRGQLITFLWRAAGSPAPSLPTSPYSDTEKDNYYYDAALWAFENGIIAASSDGRFHPEDETNRGQALTFLYRAAGDEPAIDNPFTDVEESDYYYEPALWAREKGVTAGTSATSFGPDDPVTRGQLMIFLYRIYGGGVHYRWENNTPDFEKAGLSILLKEGGSVDFTTICYDNPSRTTTGQVSVDSYEIFDSDDSHPAREGWEWRSVTLRASFSDNNVKRYGVSFYRCMEDYYNIRLHDDGGKDLGDGESSYPILFEGEEYTEEMYSEVERDGNYVYLSTFTVQVPKGYDGVVVGLVNSGLEWPEDGYIYDIFQTEYLVLFRMDG